MTDRALGFRSLGAEITTTLPVEGDLPTWLSGTLIRNGPGSFAVGGEREVGHWFDGLAMVHAFSFGSDNDRSDGGDKLRYWNRFLDTDAYRAARAGDLPGGFATGETTLRDRLRAFLVGKPYDNANIIAERVGERYLALTESPRWIEFDPGSLETIGDVRYRGPEPSGQLACAHLQRDPWTDRLVNVEIEFGRRSAYHVYEMSRPNRREHVVSIPIDEPAYMHSFALTRGFVVLTEFPLVVSPTKALRPGKQGPFITNFEWKPERGTTFYVIDRGLGEVIAAPRTEAIFGFHHVNAYEANRGNGTDDGVRDGTRRAIGTDGTNGFEGCELVIDLETVPDPGPLGGLSLSDLREGDLGISGGAIDRFRVRLGGRANASVERTRIYEGATGLPTVSPARWCREYRYAYAWGADQPMTDWPKTVVKVDVESGVITEFTEGGNYLGEPIFVPRPASDEEGTTGEEGRPSRFPVRSSGRGSPRRDLPEDDGVVLVVALDTDAEHSWLLVLDGSDLSERARAAVPHAIPFDFHGRYFPELISD